MSRGGKGTRLFGYIWAACEFGAGGHEHIVTMMSGLRTQDFSAAEFLTSSCAQARRSILSIALYITIPQP